jgi:aldose 1-epimerase
MAMFDDLPAAGQLVTLRSAQAELVVAPSCGARIVAFRAGRCDVLRPTTRKMLDSAFVYGFAAFPLMPYSGPIFGDGFRFRGEWHPLGRNVPTEPTTTHGEAWIRPWTIVAQSDAEIRLAMDYAPAASAFPFAWRGDITYRLEQASLTVDLKVTNRDHRPMPAGLGLHPYFPRPSGTKLTFDCAGIWPPDAPEAVGQGTGPLVPGLDFRQGQDVSDIVFDRCFEGWDGRAILSMPDGRSVTIEADETFGKLQIYDAWNYPYICVEPVTNTNDGFNRAAAGVAGHAVIVLEPGRSLAGRMSITPSWDGAKSST